MLNLKLLTKNEEFEELKKKQLIIVKWKENSEEFKRGNGVREYRVVDILRGKEIICQKRNNIYFNFEMYLKKESTALEVYKVVEA